MPQFWASSSPSVIPAGHCHARARYNLPPMRAPNLSKMLAAQEDKLRLSLEHARGSFEHSGTKGADVERAVRLFLSDHLPRYLDVGTGEAIDRNDARSGQLDIVITNEDQPFRSSCHEPGLFVIEGIAAAGEVKSTLTTTTLEEASNSGARFKALRNEHLEGDAIFAQKADLHRFIDCPPFFVLAFESSISDSTLLQRLRDMPLVAVPGRHGLLAPIDGVFILGKCSAIDFGDGQGALRFEYTDGPSVGHGAAGWLLLEGASTLLYLLLWLNVTMPRVKRFGSVSAHYFAQALKAVGGRHLR